MWTSSRLGPASLALLVMLGASGCTTSTNEADPSTATSLSARPTATAEATPTASPSASPTLTATPTPTPGTGPRDDVDPPAIPTLEGVSSIVSLATKDPSGGGVLVGGYVSGVLEDGGECTFTVTASGGGAAVVARTTGMADVNTTSCGSTTVAVSGTGTFGVVLTYRNADGKASSAAVSVVIS